MPGSRLQHDHRAAPALRELGGNGCVFALALRAGQAQKPRMRPATAVCPDAVLLRPLTAHAWWVRLPNGHELAGVIRRVDRPAAAAFRPGQAVAIEIWPSDFSRGRLHPARGVAEDAAVAPALESRSMG
jgi:translation initiation factor IF-1